MYSIKKARCKMSPPLRLHMTPSVDSSGVVCLGRPPSVCVVSPCGWNPCQAPPQPLWGCSCCIPSAWEEMAGLTQKSLVAVLG